MVEQNIPTGSAGSARPVLRVERHAAVVLLTLDRPGRLNAIGTDTVALL